MNPWLETIGVILVALLGSAIGTVLSSSRKHYWVTAYFLSLGIITAMAAARFSNYLTFRAPFYWLIAGRTKFVIMSLTVTMGLSALLSKLPRRCEKILTYVLMTLVVSWFCVLPFLVPALIRDELANLSTRLDSNGVCLQSKPYTCAPAAAVTALRKLGIKAQEGEIAVLSHTSPVAGTLPMCLYSALQSRYGGDGLRCEYRYFDSLEQLKNAGVTLAMVKDAFLNDHCVAVLNVSDKKVIVGDPEVGRMLLTYKQFEKMWRFSGIVLSRDTRENI